MHPVLVEVPWPKLGVALWPAFAVLVCFGVVTGIVAARRKNHFVAALGGILAVLASVLLLTSRTSRIAPAPFEVRSWGVAFAAALLVGSILFIRRADSRGLGRELAVRACIAAAVGGVVGARLVWVLLHPAATESLDEAAAFYGGGLSVWGGIAGALAGVKVVSRRDGVSLGEISDLAAPSFGAVVLLVRVGCFFEGCDFGRPLGSGAPRFLRALGTFPKDSPAWVEHVLSRDLAASAPVSLPVHPTELYEALGGGVLVVAAFALDRLGLRSGLTFAGIFLSYLLLRVSLDWLRDDPVEMWVSRALLLLAIVAYGLFRLRFRFRPQAR
jgi:phosphatidylglycerol:prolipoprotein diacylglycerol transferase